MLQALILPYPSHMQTEVAVTMTSILLHCGRKVRILQLYSYSISTLVLAVESLRLATPWNGMEWNGMEWNGMEWNGMD